MKGYEQLHGRGVCREANWHSWGENRKHRWNNYTSETLEAANREIKGGMKVLKSLGGEFDHVGKVEQAINGLNRQAKHLEKVLERSGLSKSQVGRINGLIERARGLLGVAQQAITKDPI